MKYNNLTKDFLYDEHWNMNKSLDLIAKENNIKSGSINYVFKKFNIKTRNKVDANKLRTITLDDSVLIDLYLNKKLTLNQIANKFNVCKVTVFNRLKKHNIEFRKFGRTSWNKGTKSKYYCIDCNAEVTRKKSKRCISCRSKYFAENYKISKKTRNKMSLSAIKRLKNPKERLRLAKVSALSRNTFNKSEQFLFSILNELFPNKYKYVGDGKIWIDRFNPDFVSNDNKIIELFGEFWHLTAESKKRDSIRIKTYKDNNYDVLIIWYSELNNIKQLKTKIINFEKD